MKLKKSDLVIINDTLENAECFLNGFLDFCDDNQSDYVLNLLENIRKSEDVLNELIK